MKSVIIPKPAGITMNQLIIDYKNQQNKNAQHINKICFAGRLDPMARGLCLFLLNDECKKINEYKSLSKTYQFRIIIGLQTTSDDPLGIIQNINSELMTYKNCCVIKDKLESFINTKFKQEFEQKFHKFSTKCFNMKPTQKDLEPSHLVSIKSFKIEDYEKYDFQEWKERIISQINNIDSNCNFNQSNIIQQWNEIIALKELYAIPVTLTVSSGFYVRQFVRDFSDLMEFPLMTYDINRLSFCF
jgi:tRNA U55 pseudouridine synthase TruB